MRCVMSLCSKAVDFSMFTFSMNAQNVEAGKKKKKNIKKKTPTHTHRNGNPELLRVRLDFCQALVGFWKIKKKTQAGRGRHLRSLEQAFERPGSQEFPKEKSS